MEAETLLLGPDDAGSYVIVRGGRIAYLGRESPADPGGAVLLECRGTTLAPGMVNAHTHLYSGLVPLGMPPPAEAPASFLEILERVWWPLDRALDAATLRTAARFYIAEALLAGTTCLVDHHESPNFIEGSLDILAEVCEELGIRAVLCYGVTERNDGRTEALRGLGECRRFLKANRRPFVRGMVGIHASFTVSDETIREAGDLCRDLGAGLHVHLAEDRADVEDAVRRGYPGPLERLVQLGEFPEGSVLAHGVHLTPEQVRATVDRGYWIVQNPRSNRGNGVGYPRALRESHRVAVGTDGYPSRMADEAAALEEEGGYHEEQEIVLDWRLEAGRQMIGEIFPGSDFSWRAGSTADLGAFGENGVRHLVIGGNLVVRDGALVRGKLSEIRAAAKDQAARLWTRLEKR
jgi:cytosine/adenosine deaminase-related metal-dependent hydrolase